MSTNIESILANHFTDNHNPNVWFADFYVHCLLNDKPHENLLEIVDKYMSPEEFIIYTLYSGMNGTRAEKPFVSYGHGDTIKKLLMHLHAFFGQTLINVIEEINKSKNPNEYLVGEFLYYCLTVLNIKSDPALLLTYLFHNHLVTEDTISLNGFKFILEHANRIDKQAIYDKRIDLLTDNDEYNNILFNYVDKNETLNAYADRYSASYYRNTVNMNVLKKYVKFIPHQKIALVCKTYNLNLDGGFLKVSRSDIIAQCELLML